MKIIVAPDSYKGSLSAADVADCMARGILEALPEADIVAIPMADGGEGTLAAVMNGSDGEWHALEVTGPLGEPVEARFGVMPGGNTAIIEMAEASGITLVPPERLNPMTATSYGTGQLIRAALDCGCRSFIIGLGGSATNDGGAGAMQALGVRFCDSNGLEVPPGGGSLHLIRRIDASGLDPRLAECCIRIASDVTNPLCGPEGASAIFGPQKGATELMVGLLDGGLFHYSEQIRSQLGKDVRHVRGGGAAGGMAAGLMAFLSARIESGVGLVLEACRFEERIRGADLVITGEGRTDAQTAFGKTPVGVALAARTYGIPVVCISGGITLDAHKLRTHGIEVAIGATQAPIALGEAIRDTRDWLRQSVASAMRLVLLGEKLAASRSIRHGQPDA